MASMKSKVKPYTFNRAAVPRRQEFGDAGLRHLRALRDREAGRVQAEGVPARRLRLQRLFDPDRDPARSGGEAARSGAALRRCLGHRLVPLYLRRQPARKRADQEAESGNDRRAACLFHRQDEGIRHRRFRRLDQARHRRHDRRAHEKFLRQDGARRRGQSPASTTSAPIRCNSSTRASASSCGRNELARFGQSFRCATSARRSRAARSRSMASISTCATANSSRCWGRPAAASRPRCASSPA